MSFGLFGVKVGMTQVFDSIGVKVSVTIISVGPCYVIARKPGLSDDYYFAMIGYGDPGVKLKKPLKGFFDKNKISPKKYIKEFRFSVSLNYNVGDVVNVDSLSIFNKLNISGSIKGRGFQGVIKRHNFHRGPMSHGSRHHRSPGSIGACAYPARVFKGKKLPGRMGGRVTIKNLDIFDICSEEGVVLVKGSVPGFNGSFLYVYGCDLKKNL